MYIYYNITNRHCQLYLFKKESRGIALGTIYINPDRDYDNSSRAC